MRSTRKSTQHIDLGFATDLYRKHGDALRQVREEQRAYLTGHDRAKAQLDDIEAELTYLMLRDRTPSTVVEIGCLHGWSTTWMLRALRDNGHGTLHSFDLIDRAPRNVPDDLADGRWEFHHGDIRDNRRELPADIDYLFIDAAHSAGFARWYIEHVFPMIPAGTPVSVHDVFHGKRPKPVSEGTVMLSWLAERNADYFTASAAKAPDMYRRLQDIKSELDLATPIRTPTKNPMLFFRMPGHVRQEVGHTEG